MCALNLKRSPENELAWEIAERFDLTRRPCGKPRSRYHHICDRENLRDSFHALEANKAVGVDAVTKSMYGDNLEANLQDLSARLKRMGYRAQPKRRSYIPKPGSEQGRPLGISSFEDKIVEHATKAVVEPLFESLFESHWHDLRIGNGGIVICCQQQSCSAAPRHALLGT